MEKQSSDYSSKFLVYTDVLEIFELTKGIRWKSLRRNSIHRILYLASVLYTFRYPQNKNPFDIYHFSIDANGPFNSEINDAIAFLLKDDYLERADGDDILKAGTNSAKAAFSVDIARERYDWLKQVIYILGIYGENKIYEFIFRDPEYQTTLKSNTQQGLDTDEQNDTVKTLRSFQRAFEETLQDASQISSEEYLALYFEYVFGKIIKRETN